MPRIYRQESPTGYYHVMTRGINKDKIFRYESDKKYLLKIIVEKNREVFCNIYSYCIMDNHLHLLIEGSIDDLSLLMKKVNSSYAFYYNSKNNRIGPVFQDRFKSEIIFNDEHFLCVLRYIHNNPVKANMVSKAEFYNRSSMKEYIEGENHIITRDALEIVNINFKTIDNFIEFHQIEDENDYLEVVEELMINKDEYGKRIVSRYLEQVKIDTVEELKNKDELIIRLLEEEKFSYREIGKLVRCSVGKVANMNKVLRP
ncbi:MAG: transposase [Tissierellaceae bacterium]|nr:transposase [Tissierellaceae bacterium]